MLIVTLTHSDYVSFTVESLFSSFPPLPPSFLPPPPHLTQAALMGGTTMVMALVLPEQHCSLLDAYENCRALADAKACCDYALHVGVTWWGPKVRPREGGPHVRYTVAWKHFYLLQTEIILSLLRSSNLYSL